MNKKRGPFCNVTSGEELLSFTVSGRQIGGVFYDEKNGLGPGFMKTGGARGAELGGQSIAVSRIFRGRGKRVVGALDRGGKKIPSGTGAN